MHIWVFTGYEDFRKCLFLVYVEAYMSRILGHSMYLCLAFVDLTVLKSTISINALMNSVQDFLLLHIFANTW